VGHLNRRRRRVWVDGAEYGTEREAAEAAGVSASSVHEALKAGGRAVKGKMITPGPLPGPCAVEIVAEVCTPLGRKALLYFPPGEGPLYHGLKPWS
jgi:hypothetical protein